MLPCSMQGFLYSFFLIPEFLLWASCPWPNHCCLTQVSHGEQKQKTHSRLSPSSSVASLPWPEWLTSTPAVTLMALAQLSQSLPQHSLQWYRTWQEMSRRNLGKEEKFHEHNPIHVLQTVLLLLLLAHGQTQTKSESVYPFPRNSIVPTSQQWRENNCVWNVSRTVECRPVLVSRFLFGEPLGVHQR